MKIIEEKSKIANHINLEKINYLDFFVGQVMKETQGSADPKVVNEIFEKNSGLHLNTVKASAMKAGFSCPSISIVTLCF